MGEPPGGLEKLAQMSIEAIGGYELGSVGPDQIEIILSTIKVPERVTRVRATAVLTREILVSLLARMDLLGDVPSPSNDRH